MEFYPEPQDEEPAGKATLILSTDFCDRLMKLVHKSSRIDVHKGDTVTSFRGEKWVIWGGSAPHKESSQGKVYVHYLNLEEGSGNIHSTQGLYPTVFGLMWVLA